MFSGFIVKPQNELVWPVFVFFNPFVRVFFNLAAIFELKINLLVRRTRITIVNLVRDYRFLIIHQEIEVHVLIYHWYVQAFNYRVHTYQLVGLINSGF